MKDLQFLYVKTIVEEKSFSRAAKKLGISQPALSSYITKLEKQLKVQLFDRTISPVRLTEIGKYYLDYADYVMDATERFQMIVSDISDLKTGKIILGSTGFFSSCYIPEPTSSFLSKYPGVHISVFEGRVPDIESKCLDGEIDLFLADANIDSDLFEVEKLFDERVLVLIPPQNPINDKLKDYQIPVEEIIKGNVGSADFKDLDLSVLKDERFVLLNEEQHIRKITDDMCKLNGFKPIEVMQVPQMMTSHSLTLAGIGVSFITESAVKYSNITKHPICYRLNKSLSSRTMALVYKKNKYLPKACKLYIDEYKKYFSQQNKK